MKKISFLIFFLVFSGSLLLCQDTIQNPVLRGMNPDPTICRVGEDYYLVTSTFEYFPGLPVYQSKDLVHWKLIGHVLSRNSNNPLLDCASGTGGQYAPTIRYHEGTFYVTCTNYGGSGSQGAFYVTAKDPAGEWSDPHWVNNWAVDPSLLFANDTIYYVYPDDGGFMLTTLDTVTGRFGTTPRKIANGLGGASPEGPHLYKINDYYYLMSAEGGTGYDHSEVIQRSNSPWGPYESCPHNPIITHKDNPGNPFQAIGHADLTETPDGWWLFCLGIRPVDGSFHVLGRETFMAPVTWEDGWPKIGTDGIVQPEYTAPSLTPHVWEEEPVRDNFDTTELGLQWNFIRNPNETDWSLTENPGFLRLYGSELSYRETGSPAFIGRRQTEWDIHVSANISFTPTAPNEEAGLVVRANDNNQYDFLITQFAGEKSILMRKYIRGKAVNESYKKIADGDVILHISSNAYTYYFWLEESGKSAILIDSAEAINMSIESANRFTGTYIGMYASGNGTANTNPADYDWFDYDDNPEVPFQIPGGSTDTLNNMITPNIISVTSSSYDKAEITWNKVTNATSYIIERFVGNNVEIRDTIFQGDTVYMDSGLSGNTIYIYRVIANNNDGESYPSIARSVLTEHAPGPFYGTPHQIPGQIEAEDYDYGKNNEAYYDSDAGNNVGEYRNDDVEIEACWGDNPTGYNIGWIEPNEWLTYTVDVNDTLVDIQLRIASISAGSMKLQLDGEDIAEVDLPITGDWQTWETVTVPNVQVKKGTNQILKVIFLSSGFNFNWMKFVQVGISTVNDIKNDGILLFPNPTDSKFQVCSSQNNIDKVEIYSVSGKKIKALLYSNESSVSVDISDLINNVYFVCIYTSSHNIIYKKIIKYK